jgi:hypothetical protein
MVQKGVIIHLQLLIIPDQVVTESEITLTHLGAG